MQQVVTMTDRRAALAKRLGLQAPPGEANAQRYAPSSGVTLKEYTPSSDWEGV